MQPWMTASEITDGSKYIRHGMKKELRIGTWNILTLYKGRALKQLKKVLQGYKVDTGRSKSHAHQTKSCYKFYCS
jgi:hypothetical protein